MFLHHHATAPLPRYTSYPPANRFHDGVTGEVQARWVDAIGPTDSLSLYVHVPFCAKLCWYCGCHTSIPNDEARVHRFTERLLREIDLVAAHVPVSNGVCSIHFGGGTPTMLEPDALRRLLAALRSSFPMHDDADVAVEIDPRTLDDARIAALAEAGVTRASLGVRDVDPEVQRAINRVQPTELVADRIDALKRAGITRINADLMYGLPGQTVGHVRASADAVTELGVDRIAVFGYAHVPWFKKHQSAIDATLLPGAQARFEQAEAVEDQLVADGYVAIGIDHFAKPEDSLAVAAREGQLRRNFQGYTDDPADALLGFGPSAISALPDGYVQNAPHLKHWGDLVDSGQLSGVRGVQVLPEDRLRRAVIERVLCDGAVDLAEVAARAGHDTAELADAFDRLSSLVEDGLVAVDGWRVSATPMGRRYWRTIAACFDPGLTPSATRHSQAV
jgi:oxygen-independent coproporphyrinogen-3 oxidase